MYYTVLYDLWCTIYSTEYSTKSPREARPRVRSSTSPPNGAQARILARIRFADLLADGERILLSNNKLCKSKVLITCWNDVATTSTGTSLLTSMFHSVSWTGCAVSALHYSLHYSESTLQIHWQRWLALQQYSPKAAVSTLVCGSKLATAIGVYAADAGDRTTWHTCADMAGRIWTKSRSRFRPPSKHQRVWLDNGIAHKAVCTFSGQ